jgi:adenosylcobinamide-phosphate synthase
MMSYVGAMLVAIGLDAAIGWPAQIYDRIGHPVTWLGRLISTLDSHWNLDNRPAWWRKVAGVAAALVVIVLASAAALLLQSLLPIGWAGLTLAGLLAWPLLSLRSLYCHVKAVADPLAANDLDGARNAVAMIVGRDPASLDEAGIARAALESLAENMSDGIVAPVFWGAIFGLPGIAAYKAINTLDSMIGHHSARYEDFGWASARIDDAANFVPARVTGLLVAAVSVPPITALRCMLRDARKHRSPNAGWPEAAMAGALGVRVSGPRLYHGRVSDEPWINLSGRDPDAGDIRRGLGLYARAMVALGLLLAIAAYATTRL